MIKYVLFSMACIFGAEQVHLETRNTYNIYIYTLGGGGSPGGEGVGWDGVGWDINVLTTTSLILRCQRMFHQLGRP